VTHILGIETSCDETAVAIVNNGRELLSNVIASQIEMHRPYGGVFPEVASRQHVLAMLPTLDSALQQASLSWDDLAAIAVTYGPGLAGSLLVGVNTAKALAWARDLPLVGVNHIEAHIYGNWLGEGPEPELPAVCLIVSGGHTDLILMRDHGDYVRLGGTLDDAAGEAFDKVGRLLGMDYPGGPAIEAAAGFGRPDAFDLPRAWLPGSYDFSFSGLKTAVLYLTQQYTSEQEAGIRRSGAPARGRPRPPRKVRPLPVNDAAASFQAAVVDVLVEKTRRAAEEYSVRQVLLAGGVAANEHLRREMRARAPVPVRCPPVALCTDNGAIVAAAGHYRYLEGERAAWDLDVVPSLRLLTTQV
jgi:N6-L-threonylcarbamoyladenine synthase